VEKGRYVGYIDYENDFFGYFIPDEIEIYNKVFKYWEDCDARFEKLGALPPFSAVYAISSAGCTADVPVIDDLIS
jgi:hypothetical protein